MYFLKPSINENDLAIIERGDTAEHSIEAGQYVSWKGKLGKANAAILQGATLDDSLFSYETDGVINSISNKLIPGTTATEIATYTGTGEQVYNVTFEEGMYGIYAMNGLLNIRYAGVFGFGVLSNEAITSVMNAGYVPAGTHEVRFKGNASSSKGVIAKLF